MWRRQTYPDPVRLCVRYIIAFLAVHLCMGVPLSSAEWAQQSCSFPYRIPVTISATTAGHSTETRIDLTAADFPAAYNFTSAGDDIRVFESDDTTPVDFVVSEWDDVAQTATIYVRLPAIPPSGFETIYIYLGDNGLSAGSNAPIVFPDIGMRLRLSLIHI